MLFPEQDRASIEARLLDKCTNDIITGCWLWTASLTNKGYGELMLRHTKRTELAHRLAYCIFCGPIPPGAHVRHKCDVPRCINPAHLEVGSHRDNMRDMMQRDRGRSGRRFEKEQRLTNDDVTAIRGDMRSGTIIAKEFGVTRQYVNQLKRGMYR